MLELEWSPSTFRAHSQPKSIHTSSNRMPVDFAAYLLSSSPPGFEFYALRSGKSLQGINGFGPVKPIIQQEKEETVKTDKVTEENQESHDDISQEKEQETKSDSSLSKSKKGKRVSFADELGFCLTAVRIMTESSDTPPRLKPDILGNLTRGASAGVTETPPLLLSFKQPASDYLAFREKIAKDFVSLENVILKDYNLLGTVKVKNISFEKKVTVRCTFNSWESFTDIPAHYVNSPSSEGMPYDTFSFQISVPPNFDVNKKVEFCVRYEADNREFWDSNNGANYGIVSADWKNKDGTNKLQTKDTNTIFSLGPVGDWTEYSSWNYLESSVPYW